MTDRRFHPVNDHVAHISLKGLVAAPRLVDGTPMRCVVPVADLCARPGGARDKQMLLGDGFQMLDSRDGWSFGFDLVDGYVGYLRDTALGHHDPPTHRIRARSSHVYSAPDIKSRELAAVSFFSGLVVDGEQDGFVRLATGGFVPEQHVVALDWRADDPVTVAQAFLGTPYLWGGNSSFGLDCSGLVQLALHAAGRDCARDSDLQVRLGTGIDRDGALRRGDLVFWTGHVGMMLDDRHLIHANAHHMSVATEPLAQARTRIAAHEFGEITTVRRL